MLDILLCPVSTWTQENVEHVESFRYLRLLSCLGIEFLLWLENAILNLVFANSHVTYLLSRVYRSVLDIPSYPESTIRPTMVGPGENFSK